VPAIIRSLSRLVKEGSRRKSVNAVNAGNIDICPPGSLFLRAVARKPRIEIAGGLYHIITRGSNRSRIFRSHDVYLKFLAFLESQKAKRPFYLYAYCLMPNHVHLLAEMLDERISRVTMACSRLLSVSQSKVQEGPSLVSRAV
jgi:REP element-mobilizing transposase RayT